MRLECTERLDRINSLAGESKFCQKIVSSDGRDEMSAIQDEWRLFSKRLHHV
jgi:hypothetical protein